jgi:hypothetical protein
VTEPAMHNGVIKPFPILYIGKSCDNRHIYNRQLSRTEFDIYKTDGPNREAFGGMTCTEASLREQAAGSSTGSRGPFTRIISVPPPASANSGQSGILTLPLPQLTGNQGGKAQKIKSTKRTSPCKSLPLPGWYLGN